MQGQDLCFHPGRVEQPQTEVTAVSLTSTYSTIWWGNTYVHKDLPILSCQASLVWGHCSMVNSSLVQSMIARASPRYAVPSNTTDTCLLIMRISWRVWARSSCKVIIHQQSSISVSQKVVSLRRSLKVFTFDHSMKEAGYHLNAEHLLLFRKTLASQMNSESVQRLYIYLISMCSSLAFLYLPCA